MKRIVFSTLVGGALIASTVGSAFAADPSLPGTPGTPGCQGQTTAYLAQGHLPGGARGLGNVADVTGLSVQQLHALVDAYCAGLLP